MDLKAPTILSVTWLLAALNGCHTAQGFGKDIEVLGLMIQGKMNPSANGEGYVKEEPYAQELVDWSHPLKSGASQKEPDNGQKTEPYPRLQQKKTTF